MSKKKFISTFLFLIVLLNWSCAAEYKVADLHNDILVNLLQDKEYLEQDKPEQQMSFEKIKKGNYKLLTFAIWLPMYFYDEKAKKSRWMRGDGWGAIEKLRFQNRNVFKYCIDILKETFTDSKEYILINDRKSLEAIENDSRTGILLSIEGLDMVKGIEDMKWLYENGIRVFGLTWNLDNAFAHSHWKKEGLTEKGGELIRNVVKLGGVIDVSHSSEKTIFDVIERTGGKSPIIASHSGARSICDISRNLSDEAIKAIARTGGVIGVPFYKVLLTKKKGSDKKLEVSIEDILDTIDYLAKITSVDNVAIGSDYGTIIPPSGLENAGNVQRLAIGLLNRGYPAESVKKIMCENVFRVLKNILN